MRGDKNLLQPFRRPSANPIVINSKMDAFMMHKVYLTKAAEDPVELLSPQYILPASLQCFFQKSDTANENQVYNSNKTDIRFWF